MELHHKRTQILRASIVGFCRLTFFCLCMFAFILSSFQNDFSYLHAFAKIDSARGVEVKKKHQRCEMFMKVFLYLCRRLAKRRRKKKLKERGNLFHYKVYARKIINQIEIYHFSHLYTFQNHVESFASFWCWFDGGKSEWEGERDGDDWWGMRCVELKRDEKKTFRPYKSIGFRLNLYRYKSMLRIILSLSFFPFPNDCHKCH